MDRHKEVAHTSSGKELKYQQNAMAALYTTGVPREKATIEEAFDV